MVIELMNYNYIQIWGIDFTNNYVNLHNKLNVCFSYWKKFFYSSTHIEYNKM